MGGSGLGRWEVRSYGVGNERSNKIAKGLYFDAIQTQIDKTKISETKFSWENEQKKRRNHKSGRKKKFPQRIHYGKH